MTRPSCPIAQPAGWASGEELVVDVDRETLFPFRDGKVRGEVAEPHVQQPDLAGGVILYFRKLVQHRFA